MNATYRVFRIKTCTSCTIHKPVFTEACAMFRYILVWHRCQSRAFSIITQTVAPPPIPFSHFGDKYGVLHLLQYKKAKDYEKSFIGENLLNNYSFTSPLLLLKFLPSQFNQSNAFEFRRIGYLHTLCGFTVKHEILVHTCCDA